MKLQWLFLSAFLWCMVPNFAKAQQFFTPGVTSFSPEIAVLFTGMVNDVTPTVSADRKYVTLNMRPQNSQLLNLYQFKFNQPPLANGIAGFVGNVQFPQAGVVRGAFGTVNPPVAAIAGNGEQILTQRGMTPVHLK